MAFQILIVDEEPQRLRWLRSLAGVDDLEIVGAGQDLHTALAFAAASAGIDVLLIGVDRPQMASPRGWAMLRSVLPYTVRIAAVTDGKDKEVLASTLAAGVAALHPPEVEPSALRDALRKAAQGEVDFDPELVDRARALLLEPIEEHHIIVGGLVIDIELRSVSRWGLPIELTSHEFRLLARLARSKNEFVTRDVLLRAGWGANFESGGTDDQLRSMIKRLRHKIEPDPRLPRYLVSTRGRGYMLQDPMDDSPSES